MSVKSSTYTTTIPILITFIVSVVIFTEYFVDIPQIATAADTIRQTSIILFAFSILLGTTSLILWQRKRITTGKGMDRNFSIWTILILVLFSGIGIIFGVNSNLYNNLFQQIRFPIAQGMSGIKGFWCTSAIYRSWRAKNKESLAMLIFGLIVIVGLSPWGASSWGGFVTMSDWVMDYINKPGMRAIIIGGALGTIILSIRTIFGQESGYLRG